MPKFNTDFPFFSRLHGRFQTQSSLVDAKQDDVRPRPREVNDYSATTLSVSHKYNDADNDNDFHSSSDRSPRKCGRVSRGTGGVSKERAATPRGVTLSLDGVGLQDETLYRVSLLYGISCSSWKNPIFIPYIPSRPVTSRHMPLFSLLRNVSDREFIMRF